ncbi:hypothetical protein REO92_005345 [Citrobacter freundii]|jgi:cell filamentation protein|nr:MULTISPECIES: hypothetical protein [Enterobacteriaceae]EFA9606021.1 hypothetical protein [Escherichia coli]MEB7707468.1 hypothetical protein [Citrobacter braakii]QLW58600.1 hypothetical protein HV258_03335 [Citrobacter sp. RHBSTW-00667]HDG1664106.1 hypothetical protein [Kluyvera ascorbata]EKZ3398596.1 hypothetical protein [Citrobacter freundii]
MNRKWMSWNLACCFAAADRIRLLLGSFDKQFLSRSGELKSLVRPELVGYLAECHVEFILTHPFGEC